MTRYAFNGSVAGRVKRAGPQRIGEALEAIRLENAGELHPQAVVEGARPPESPLHKYFEWRDEKAAALYRVDQARALIRSIRVVDDHERSRPAFLSIQADAGRAYRSIADVMGNADLRERLLAQAQRDLDAWTLRYRELREIVELIEPARRELRRRVEGPNGEESRP
jgi:hypothetical protein